MTAPVFTLPDSSYFDLFWWLLVNHHIDPVPALEVHSVCVCVCVYARARLFYACIYIHMHTPTFKYTLTPARARAHTHTHWHMTCQRWWFQPWLEAFPKKTAHRNRVVVCVHLYALDYAFGSDTGAFSLIRLRLNNPERYRAPSFVSPAA